MLFVFERCQLPGAASSCLSYRTIGRFCFGNFSFFIECTFLTDSLFLVDNLLTVTSARGNFVEVCCRNLVIMFLNSTAFNGFDFFD